MWLIFLFFLGCGLIVTAAVLLGRSSTNHTKTTRNISNHSYLPVVCDDTVPHTDIPSIYVRTRAKHGQNSLPLFHLRKENTQQWIDKQMSSNVGSKANTILKNMYTSIQGHINTMNKLVDQSAGSINTNDTVVAPCPSTSAPPFTFECHGNRCAYTKATPWDVSRTVVSVLVSPTVTYASSSSST